MFKLEYSNLYLFLMRLNGVLRIGATLLMTLALVVPAYSLSTTIPYDENPDAIIDGVVQIDEYPAGFHDSTTTMTTHWVHNGTHLFIELISPGTGWMSIGFGPSGGGMDGSNIIIGYVEEGNTVTVIDEVGVGRNHFPDTSRGGTDDVRVAAGTADGETVIEFIIPLNSGDQLDQALQMNRTYGFFFAYHESNKNLSAIHTAFSETFDVLIEPSPMPQEPPASIEWLTVYILGALALIVAGLVAYRYINSPKVYRFSEMDRG